MGNSTVSLVSAYSEWGIGNGIMYVHSAARRGEAIERGRLAKNKVRFVVHTGQVNVWRGVAWHVMS